MLDAWCENAAGERIALAGAGRALRGLHGGRVRRSRRSDPSFAITFRNDVRHTIFVARSDREGPTGSFAAGERVTLRFGFDNWLAPSRYTLTPAVALDGERGPGARGSRTPAACVVEAAALERRRGRPAGGHGGAALVSARPAPRERRSHRPVTGPAALGDDLRRFWSLTYTLAATDFKLRFFGSALGYLWSLMRPLMLFGVLYVVFTEVIKFGEDVKYYPVYLLTSIVLFTYFAETTAGRSHVARRRARTCCARCASRGW